MPLLISLNSSVSFPLIAEQVREVRAINPAQLHHASDVRPEAVRQVANSVLINFSSTSKRFLVSSRKSIDSLMSRSSTRLNLLS